MTDETFIESPLLGTVSITRRFSMSNDGCFWAVRAKNPWPITMPDGTPSRLDTTLFESGFARRRKRMERDIRRCVRDWERRYDRALKEMGDVA